MLRHPPPCPTNWNYETFPCSNVKVTARTIRLLKAIRATNPEQKLVLSTDTRPVHKSLFSDLVPAGFEYFAGNYRGSDNRCLVDYEVGIRSDRNVGHTAATVPLEMESLAKEIKRIAAELDFVYSAPSSMVKPEIKLFRAVELISALFVYFLEIHPYANGNGHIARFLIISMLGRHNVYPNSKWNIHPRPDEPAYSQAIIAHRNGDRAPLHILLLQTL